MGKIVPLHCLLVGEGGQVVQLSNYKHDVAQPWRAPMLTPKWMAVFTLIQGLIQSKEG